MRTSEITRKTKETDIQARLNLDGTGVSDISTGIGFLDHMLELLTAHGLFDLTLTAEGDLDVDAHHTAEDIGIVLGQAFDRALGERGGITRYGSFLLPMDESLVLVALDLSGRAYLGYDVSVANEHIGTIDAEALEEFFTAFTRELRATVHFKQMSGRNTHHIFEACFKGLGHALRTAVSVDERLGGAVPSTTGIL
jgi:imidazoleglycerol-phosphate dehydratase